MAWQSIFLKEELCDRFVFDLFILNMLDHISFKYDAMFKFIKSQSKSCFFE